MSDLEIENRDIPISSSRYDAFHITPYSDALCTFIRSSDTPITIAIQGEWGCGKTSFMHLMEENLCSKENNDFYSSIWINAWEFFLEDNYDAAVEKLITEILDHIEECFKDVKQEKTKRKVKALKSYGRLLTRFVCSAAKIDKDIVDEADSRLFAENRSLNDAKNSLQELFTSVIQDTGNEMTNHAFVIFIDDLDRLNPVMSLTLLEALKNIFDMKYCVFVLAVDADVIRQGISMKYHLVDSSQRKFERDFFEKMIQVPFVIPVSRYDIRPMVMHWLHNISFFTDEADYDRYAGEIEKIVVLITRKNPRAIKRLLNMTQLLMEVQKSKDIQIGSSEFKLLELLLMGLQLKFPEVYSLIAQNSDLNSWKRKNFNYGSSVKITEENEREYHLNEDWEKVVFLSVADDPVLLKNYYRIDELLVMYKRLLEKCEANGDDVADALGIINLVCGNVDTDMEIFYSGEAYDANSGIQASQGTELIRQIHHLDRVHDVLDIGCGNGVTTIELFHQNPNMRIKAFDISQEQIDVANRHWKEECAAKKGSGSIYFTCMAGLDLNEKSKYDLVFSNSAMHWIQPADQMYRKIYKALKLNGKIAIHQGGAGTYQELHEAAREAIDRAGFSDLYKGWEFPAYYPTADEMEKLLKKTGFSKITVDKSNSIIKATDELVQSFITASLLFYKRPGLISDDQFEEIEREFKKVCKEKGEFDVHVNRLYIFARKLQND